MSRNFSWTLVTYSSPWYRLRGRMGAKYQQSAFGESFYCVWLVSPLAFLVTNSAHSCGKTTPRTTGISSPTSHSNYLVSWPCGERAGYHLALRSLLLADGPNARNCPKMHGIVSIIGAGYVLKLNWWAIACLIDDRPVYRLNFDNLWKGISKL